MVADDDEAAAPHMVDSLRSWARLARLVVPDLSCFFGLLTFDDQSEANASSLAACGLETGACEFEPTKGDGVENCCGNVATGGDLTDVGDENAFIAGIEDVVVDDDGVAAPANKSVKFNPPDGAGTVAVAPAAWGAAL
jgi:hypothetical protein